MNDDLQYAVVFIQKSTGCSCERKVRERDTSRSKHTDPKKIRAKRRVHAPREPRSAGDPSNRRQIGRMLKEMGIAYVLQDRDLPIYPILPRIIIKRPRPGYLHALEKSDVLQILNFVGPEAIYGLRSIEFVQQSAVAALGLQPFGQLIVPGRIKLFEQPEPPWRLQGVLPQEEAEILQRAGAQLEVDPEIMATFVHWSEESLRNFMVFEVLLHEVGHHILQHNTGKRTKRVVRTRDHEAFAKRFVERYRAAWFDEEIFD